MPPASLSTLGVMKPGPTTARDRAMRRRQALPREKKSQARARRRSMRLWTAARFMGVNLQKGREIRSRVGSCVHQAGNYVVYGDGADGAIVLVGNGEHTQIIFVEKFENVFFAVVGSDGHERLGLQLTHVLGGRGEKQASYRNGAGECMVFVDQHDVVELLEIEILMAHPLENFFAGRVFADEREFGVHHAAGGGGIEAQQLADL